ncbi:pyroglutamyl-peptidase I [Kumtagia ephedrae]|nr:pyroglutamyl-peptidase I [Mesorhizobium ephedrae]
MRAGGRKNLPRVLVTGFEAFPDQPVNPTEALVGRLGQQPPVLDGMAAFRAELLPVDYAAIGPRLSGIGRDFRPDIAIHFGLAAGCGGFRLERQARNLFARARPDNRDFAPPDGPICAGPAVLPSTLPLDAIHDALVSAGLPVEWSDDAGGYLCNVTLTLSLAAACTDFSPRASGFVHVPLVGEGCALTERQLERGLAIMLAAVLRHWPLAD